MIASYFAAMQPVVTITVVSCLNMVTVLSMCWHTWCGCVDSRWWTVGQESMCVTAVGVVQSSLCSVQFEGTSNAVGTCVSVVTTNNNNNGLTDLCPELPGWTITRINIHPLIPILIINHLLSAFSIYYNPLHPPYSIYVLDSLFAQPLSISHPLSASSIY